MLKTMYSSRMLEEKDGMQSKKMQILAREHVKRVLDEKDKWNADYKKQGKLLICIAESLTKGRL